jgi:hypothetical protein
MDFAEALTAMKLGSHVSRELWRGKVSNWRMDGEPPRITATYPSGVEEMIHSLLAEDILADDWWIVT